MKRVLLLEDDVALLRLYTKVLQNAGYTVIAASTLQAVQTLPNIQNFDLCISDVHVGFVSGETLIGTLNQFQRKYQFPVLVISGNIEKYQTLCDSLGLATLPKPFTNAALLSAVEHLMAAVSIA